MKSKSVGSCGRLSATWDKASRNQKEQAVPTFSRSLEKALHRALAFANERHHEFATLEHLLLSLIEDKDAVAVMRACNVNWMSCATAVNYVDTELANLISG
jgi:ATP-dependent Clp protease ATP-binding subunit ClpA